MIDIMKNRRTIRKYTEQDIPEELLNELLEVAVRTVWLLPVTSPIRRNWPRLILISQ